MYLQAEKCKQQMSSQMKDRKVAGYYTSQDRPEFQQALAHVILESKTGVDPAAERRKQEAAQFIKNIRDDEEARNKQLDDTLKRAKLDPDPKEAKAEDHKEQKDSRASHIDKEVLKQIEETILDSSPNVKWDDVKGLVEVKKVL
jgi:spastin